MIWAAGAGSLALLVVQIVAHFELRGLGAFVYVGDLAAAGLYYHALRRSCTELAKLGRDPIPVALDLGAVWAYVALTVGSTLLWLAFGGVVPGAMAVSALGKAGLVALAIRLRNRVLARIVRSATGGESVALSPPATVVVGFGLAILAGWLLLCIPEASSSGEPIRPLDALFTATSATCVTGLIVKDTPHDFSLFGHLVILALIQAGGLGIMTFAGIFGVARGQRVSLQHRGIVRDNFIIQEAGSIRRTLGAIAVYAFVMETAGAMVLYLRWLRGGETPLRAIWLAVFHSISAFCNAGFSLFSNSLEDYSEDLTINLTVGGLIIIGGLGFPVMRNLWHYARQRREGKRGRLSLHSKLVLVTSGVLLLIGFFGFLILEWTGELLARGGAESVYAAGFQSLTPRTAGFNTVPIGALGEATKFLLILLMLVGASPGSTGGGIKTATLAVLAVLARTMIRGGSHVQVFGRAIPEAVRHRAVAIVILFGMSVLLWTFALSVTEECRFIDVLFESVSAFATVGLSAGLTRGLSNIGRLAIIAAMFMGRVGPLTIALALGRRRPSVEFQYPEEPVMVG